ncbi:PREDICTED: uncharacterized protein LOC104602622 [Nelumbo nucifera]|uniref:Senescence regulator S40 n=2 Tax=Nelumbo nucifera TaxID=4432 RepID=A0A822Y6A3_NELNU|nr:PREDICTED: uncharacterized protein LOC104602622 [Nelumbo nucifera]DAD27996.1 TPA_asm: hypothetical protein HUJ06_029464 [Nelumbo nucifera]DAD27997.1 TPA_asm: hypothetical protein HUJ06_029465 [Nelumbo nucifera]
MATGKSYLARPSYRFLGVDGDNTIGSDTMFEFDEADLWNSNQDASPEFKKFIPNARVSKKLAKRVVNADRSDGGTTTAMSLPVNIPDWSKILREDYRASRRAENDEDFDDDDNDSEDNKIPPHEFLARQFARTQIASFSVHEGIGRTLKGRDLSRVRNAIWEKTGFQD